MVQSTWLATLEVQDLRDTGGASCDVEGDLPPPGPQKKKRGKKK